MAQQYTISAFAGNGTAGFVDGDALGGAQLNSPLGIAVDSSGKLYIADSSNHRIRAVSGGTVSTVAGNGTPSYAGDKASATSAALNSPAAVAIDGSGNLYIADTQNHVIRKVSGGTITTIAGDGTSGNQGDNGLAIGAELARPSGVAVDAAGNVYIADTDNNLIRKVETNGTIRAVVGSGTTANTLNHPTGIALDSSGAIYIADTNNQRVLKWANSKLTTIAGTGSKGYSGDGGPATRALLQNPVGIAVDAAGNVYIADSTNSRIRKITADGTIVTIAGNGKLSYSGDGGPATSAALNFPRGVAVDSQGNVYIADTSNHMIRLLQGAKPAISDGGVTNAASFVKEISPGALATVWGSNFGSSSSASGVSVNGKTAPILYVSSGQINFQVPWSTATGTAEVTVNVNGQTSNTMDVPVVAAGPGLFQNGSAAIVQDQDYSLNTPANPAAGGTYIYAYLTGSGPVSLSIADGALAPADPLVQATSSVSAKIGSADAKVQFTGLTPGFIGLVQMNILVPSGLAPGDYPLTVTIGGETSNSANVSVK